MLRRMSLLWLALIILIYFSLSQKQWVKRIPQQCLDLIFGVLLVSLNCYLVLGVRELLNFIVSEIWGIYCPNESVSLSL